VVQRWIVCAAAAEARQRIPVQPRPTHQPQPTRASRPSPSEWVVGGDESATPRRKRR
jgi:hypothetical protein